MVWRGGGGAVDKYGVVPKSTHPVARLLKGRGGGGGVNGGNVIREDERKKEEERKGKEEREE